MLFYSCFKLKHTLRLSAQHQRHRVLTLPSETINRQYLQKFEDLSVLNIFQNANVKGKTFNLVLTVPQSNVICRRRLTVKDLNFRNAWLYRKAKEVSSLKQICTLWETLPWAIAGCLFGRLICVALHLASAWLSSTCCRLFLFFFSSLLSST